MKKQFTLVEIIISTIILSVIASIILVKIIDLKKDGIRFAVESNNQIIQTAVDRYMLEKENGVYPTINQTEVTLTNPQIIDIELLKKKGYLKKELDTSKIKEQYYWVDVFGVSWGSTRPTISSMNLLQTSKGKSLEFNLSKGTYAYRIYEVVGYNKFGNQIADSGDGIQSMQNRLSAAQNSTKKNHRMIAEVKVKSGNSLVSLPLKDEGKTYLISTVDKYGLESAPVGINNKGPSAFKPLKDYEGVYEFTIESLDEMVWVDFRTLQKTPGDSTIHYKFKVKNENGVYGNWTDDYFSLPNSKAITVQVDMKGDTNGNKPSLYDVRVIYRYYDEPIPPAIVFKNPPKSTSIGMCPQGGTASTLASDGRGRDSNGMGKLVYSFQIPTGASIDDVPIPSIELYSSHKIINTTFEYSKNGSEYIKVFSENDIPEESCVHVIYEVKIIEVEEPDEERITCGNGGTETNIYNGKILDGGTEGKYVYSFKLKAGQNMREIKVPLYSTTLKYIYYEYSHKGSDFTIADKLTDIPDESCVNVVLVVEPKEELPPLPPEVKLCTDDCPVFCGGCIPQLPDEICQGIGCDNEKYCEINECITPPSCQEGDSGCLPPVCAENCSSAPPKGPNPRDAELQDPDWITINTLVFFAHGAEGQITRWIDSIEEDAGSVDGKTRIIYRYSKTNGYYWSPEVEDFSEIGSARSVSVRAYLQVYKDYVNKETLELKEGIVSPEVIKVQLINERGVQDLSLVTPTLVILPEKDNNIGRDVFSDTSKIKWAYQAADPRNREIIRVEWAGDIRNNYPAGEYEVQARVMNSSNYWSKWAVYKFKVLPDKPIAIITTNPETIFANRTIKWSFLKSYDQDGDRIVKVEWEGDKKDIYTKNELGDKSVRMRVMDEEGNWSEWTQKDFGVYDEGFKIYRLEAEDKTKFSHYYPEFTTLSFENNSNSSGGKHIYMRGNGWSYNRYVYIQHTFEGTGIAIKFKDAKDVSIYVDNVLLDTVTASGDYLYELKGLSFGTKTLKVQTTFSGSSAYVDYIDFFSEDDKPSVSNIYGRQHYNGTDGKVNSSIIVTGMNQQLRTHYTLEKDAYTSIKVYNKQGKEVKNLLPESFLEGGTIDTYFILWDGKDNNGEFVDSGVYSLEITALGTKRINKTVGKTDITVDNEKPTYKIEAEDTSKVTYYKGGDGPRNETIADSTASGGAVRYVKGTSTAYSRHSNLVYKFNGSGFDLRLQNPSKTDIYLDGVKIDTLNEAGEYIYSKRNLSDGEHTLKVEAIVGTFYADYLNVYGDNDRVTVFDIKSTKIDSIGKEINIITNSLNIQHNEQVKVYYTLFRDGYISAEIIDSNNSTVKNLFTNIKQSGGTIDTHYVTWDGKNNKGNEVSTGNYKLKITTLGTHKTHSSIAYYDLSVFNQSPKTRLEAEDKNNMIYFVGSDCPKSSRPADINASGGFWYYMKGCSISYNRTVSLTFTSTSGNFDVRMKDVSSLEVYIDGVKKETVSQSGEFIYSIRGLSNGNHTIRLYSINGSANIDYVDIY